MRGFIETGNAAQRAVHLFFVEMSMSTTLGSVRVLVSPSSEVSPEAILRRMRRMILPERVLGKPVVAK